MQIIKEKQNMPKGWSMKPLGEISKVTNGSTNTQDAVEGGEYPLFDRSVDVKRSDKYLFDDTAIILPGEGAEFVPKYYKGKFDLHQRAYAIFADVEIVPDYLFQFLYSNRKEFLKKSVGSTVRSLRLPLIQSVEVLYPESKKEQQKIAEILGAVDEDIAKTKEVIATTEKLKRGLSQQLFTRGIGHTKFKKTEIGEVPEGWEVVPFKDVVSFATGKLNSNAAVPDGEYPFFTCSQETFKTNTCAFDQEAILLAGNNANGNYSVKHYSGKFDAYQRTYIITVIDRNELDYVYFKEVLQDKLEELRNSSFGSTTKFLTLKLLESLTLKKPSIAEQKKIAEVLMVVDKKITVNKKLLAKLTELKKGLTQDLLSGRVRTIKV